MTAIVEIINAAGGAFIDFALPMLIQSCVLILVLLVVDLILRKRVRAVFRYCIWMLVLVKLVLPPTFWSPVSIGTWFGDSLRAPAVALVELAEPRPAEPAGETRTIAADILSPSAPAFTAAPVSPVEVPRPESPYLPAAGMPRDNSLADADSESLPGVVAASPSAGPSLSWQGLVFLSWAAVAVALLLLLLQRAFFVRGLVLDADEASAALQDELNRCRAQIGLRKEIALRLSALAGSPAACGLVHPVILIPQNLAPRLAAHDLRAVLLHELAHIKRGDLWVNLAQTLLQIVYFYNPLLWLANSLIRRTREQAVDEAVLVAMGEAAQQYPETLVNVAKLAFRKRPALSLRLLGVVESKSALSARIRHILNRPLPKTARLGIAGLTIILATAAVLLPMANAQRREIGSVESRFALLPDCGVWLSDIKGQDLPVLDLASERIMMLPGVKSDYDLVQTTASRREGDILYYYDRAKQMAKITFLGGAGFDASASRETMTRTIIPTEMPWETTLVTRSNSKYEVRIVQADEHGCAIHFRPLKATASAPKAILPDGIAVELIGASEHPSVGKPWWRPDGSPLEEPPYDQIGGTVRADENREAYEFAVRLKNLPAGTETTMKTEPEGSRAGGASPPRRDGQPVDDLRWLATVLPKDLQSCTVLCGVAAGEWETISQSTGYGSSSQGTAAGGVTFSPAMDRSDDGVAITVTDDMMDRPCRIVAALQDGTTVESSEALTSSAGKARQTTASFRNLTLVQVAEFRFQMRPWTWVEFRNVSLRPGHKSDVQIHIQPTENAVALDRGAGERISAEPSNVAGILEVRVAPTRDDLTPDVVAECAKALAKGQTLAGDYLWVAVRPGTNVPPDSIVQARGGKTWLLAHNQEDFTMVPGEEWRLTHVMRSTDRTGKPVIVLAFNDKGEANMQGLTEPNPGRSLVVIVNGIVVSAATIPEGQMRRTAVIAGNFTERQREDMIATLRRGIVEPSAGTDEDFRPVTLRRNGVTVELLGICEHPSVGKQWWRPDGSPLEERPYDDDEGRAFPQAGEKGYKFAVKFSGLAGKEVDAYIDPSSSKTTNGGTLSSTSTKDGKENTKYWNDSLDEVIVWQGAAFDEELNSCDIRVGVSWGRWPEGYWYYMDKPDDPVEWAVFKDVSLRPGQRADVEARIDVGAGEPVRARIVSPDAGAESSAPIDLGAADETGGSYVKVILGWSGQEVNVPGPLVLPESVKGTNEFQRWQKGLVSDKITFVDAEGHKYVVECKGMGKSPDGSARPEYTVTRYRPDQMPLAYSYFPRGDGLAAEWQTYFPNGAKRIWGLNRPDAADCKMTIRFYDAEGTKTREWHVNEHKIAYAEQVFDPNGASRFSHYLKDQIHSAYAPNARPALAEPAVLASTDKGAGGGALVEPIAKLPNGVTVRFLAYSQLTATGLNWWNTKSDLTSIPGVVEADVEGLGTILAFRIDPPQAEVNASLARGAGVEEFKAQWQLGNSGTWLFATGDQRSYANVSISTLVRDPPVVGLIPLTGEDQGKAVEVNKFGVAQIVDLQVISPGKGKPEEGAGTQAPVVQFTVVKSPISSPSVVAVEDKEGLAHELSNLSDNPQAATYRVGIWPGQLASLVIEASLVRQSHVQFRNISLAPDRTTKVQVETDPTPTISWFRSKVSQSLSFFADAVKQYLKDQHDQLPASLEGMKGYLLEDNWLTEHLAYIAKGGPVPSGGSRVIVAYDKTLLPQGKGTYVVYASIYGGSVKFESPKQLAELGILPSGQAAQPAPISEDVTPTGQTLSPSPQAVGATLANGVRVELLAYSQLKQEGLTWCTPAGKSIALAGVNEADIEGLGTVLAFRTEPAVHTLYVWSVQAPNESTSLEKTWRLNDGNIWLVALGKTGSHVNIEIQAVIADALVARPVALKKPGTGGWIAVEECGIRAVSDLTAIDSGSSRFKVHWEMLGPRVVAAVDTAGGLHSIRVTAPPRLSDPGAGAAASYEVGLPADRLASIVVEGYSDRGARASFRNVSLTPSRPTPVRVDVTPQQQGPWWRESPHYTNMDHLGMRLSRYAENHGGSYPATLSALKDAMSETEWQWLEQNAVYLGAGGSSTREAVTPLAYDNTLLPLSFGTYVLYSDGRVEFEVPSRLRELGIPADGAAGTQTAPGARARAATAADTRGKMLQLGLAVALYTNEHDGDLPATLEPLEPYLRDPQILAWLKENAVYTGKGNLKDYPAAHSVVTAYEKTPVPTGERYVVFLDGHVELAKPERLRELGLTTAEPPSQPAGDLARLVKEAQPGATVTVPKGTYRTAIEITKPLLLRGESQEGCIIEVTADQPAILVNAARKGDVTVENVTIRWQLAGDKKMDLPAALLVKDTNALIRNCRFVPLGDSKRSPMAVYIDGRSKSTVDNCRFNGFEYTVCYGAGTEGVVQDCIITDCGHQGVINYDGATLTVQRTIITGSKFHAVRCTGGTLNVKDNLLIKNANRGIYLGNKTGRGTITNNLILGNGTGVSGFGRADYAVANNVIVSNDYAGIDMRDSCLLSIRNNVLAKNQRGIMLHKEGSQNYNVIAKNTYWGNATDVENTDKAEGSITADPQFADPNHGDFSVRGPVQQQGDGLTDPKIIRELWKRYEQLQAEPGRSNPPQTAASNVTVPTATGFSGRAVDPRGSPAAGVQVALCTKDKGVSVGPTGLLPNKMGGRSTEIVETDTQGRFSFAQVPEEFQLVAAHESGFAWVADKELASSHDLPLQPWGRIEGTLRIGRETGDDEKVSLLGYINRDAIDQGVRYDYETQTDAKGAFLFKKVPPGWVEVGYMIQVGDSTWTHTCRTPVRVQPGESVKMMLGGTGRPVVGKFVPPKDYDGPVYFGEGLRALTTVRPETPKPDNYDQMTQRQRSEWYKQWYQTPEARAFYDAIWHDLSRRHYTFRINEDGSFRIEDVTPGKYQMTVYLEERLGGGGRPEEIGGYSGTIEVPSMTQAYTDEPLDVGELTPAMRRPLHVGDVAPPFGARTLDGKDIHLADYRGKYVLLSFWQPEFHPELDRIKELYKTFSSTGKLQIIGLGGSDTLEEVKKYVAEHKIEWPEVFFGEKWDDGTAGQYGLSGLPYILLVNPEGKIAATWLRGEKLTSTVHEAMKNAVGSAPGDSSAGGAGLAWQRTDRYVPPDPNRFFPDDPEAGKRLDILFKAGDRDGRPDEEILSTVRQGFRRMTQSRNSVLQWVGNHFIWGKQPQNPEAIELMYHAIPLERYYAVYSGLSVVRNKSPNLLRTLADLCMQGEQVGRITWGLGPQREEMLAYITPYLQDADPKKREIAAVLVKHFKGELDFEKWQQEKHTEQVKAEFSGQLPQLRQALLTGDSQARRDVFQTIMRKDLSAILDASFLPALRAAAADSDSSVRAEAAQLVGGLWVWGAKDQDPNAIELLLALSSDSDREVRQTSVYYGLSTVRNASEPIVRRLIEMAMADHEINLYGRIVWGLKGPVQATPELVTKTLAEHIDRAKSDVRHAASVYALYHDVLEKEPPSEWNLARIKEQYPDDAFAVPFSAKGSFQPQDADALWDEFAKSLPQGVTAERLLLWERRDEIVCTAKVRGKEQVDAVKRMVENHPSLSLREVYPLPLPMQLFLEELPALMRSRTSAQQQARSETPVQESRSAVTPAVSEVPGAIQQRIDAAAPGATIKLEPGLYKERLTINKPITLEGAGWDKTVILRERRAITSADDIESLMAQRVSAAKSDAEREQIAAQLKKELAEQMSPVALTVENAQDVVIRGIKFTSPGGHIKGASMNLPLLKLDRSRVRLSDCVVIGGPGDGIHILNGSAVEIEKTLVAAVWGTGISVGPGQSESGVRIHDCDVRNCHYAGIRVARNGPETVIERCRISGAAWHGIRYDDTSPQILGNLIFGHACSGIYASGQTAATVTGNLFYANEMCGMSCWFQNRDVIEGNTFVSNKEAGLAIAGASKPLVQRNIFSTHPVAISLGNIGEDSPFAKSDGTVALQGNLLWGNEQDLQFRRDANTTEALAIGEDTGTLGVDPGFAAPGARDFSLRTDSPARQKGIGAGDLLPFESPWPLQPEELAIIPKGDTRDSRQWRQ